MRKEIDKAVETFHRIAFGTGKNGRKTINDNQLASFVTVLTELLLIRFKNNWYPSNPTRGSGYRCLRINSQCMDPTIVDSLVKSAISIGKELRRMELTIWVDPGVVSIRIGEEGSIGTEDVEMDPPLSRKDSTSEDEAYSSSRSPSPVAHHPQSSPSSTPTKMELVPSVHSPTSSAYSTPVIHQRGVVYHQNISPSSSVFSSSPRSATSTPSSRRLSPLPVAASHPHSNRQLRRIPSPPQDLATSSAASRIPSPPQQYSRPKALFPSQEGNINGYYNTKEGMSSSTHHQSHHAAAMSMHMPSGLMQHQGNYLDIPAQA